MVWYCAAVSLCCNNAGDQEVKISTRLQNKRKRQVTQIHGFMLLTNYLVSQQAGGTQDSLNSFQFVT